MHDHGELEFVNLADRELSSHDLKLHIALYTDDEARQVQRLSLAHNRLTWLPKTIARFSNLEELDVSDNPLAVLPAELGQLTALRWFTARSCDIDALPSAMVALTKLRLISLKPNARLPLWLNVERHQRVQDLLHNVALFYAPLERACGRAIITWLCIHRYGTIEGVNFRLMDRQVAKLIAYTIFASRGTPSVWVRCLAPDMQPHYTHRSAF